MVFAQIPSQPASGAVSLAPSTRSLLTIAHSSSFGLFAGLFQDFGMNGNLPDVVQGAQTSAGGPDRPLED